MSTSGRLNIEATTAAGSEAVEDQQGAQISVALAGSEVASANDQRDDAEEVADYHARACPSKKETTIPATNRAMEAEVYHANKKDDTPVVADKDIPALLEEDNELHLFRVSVDVRSFRAGNRMPVPMANIFVRVLLPTEVIALANNGSVQGKGPKASKNVGTGTTGAVSKAGKLTAPLRTPPVDVQRGTEVVIPNGYVALELPATLRSMASALAQEPQLVVEVFHRDRYAPDTVLGVASVPMMPLLQVPFLDVYAPVVVKGKATSSAPEADKGGLGALRVVLAVEELGTVHSSRRPKRRFDGAGSVRTDGPRTIPEPFLEKGGAAGRHPSESGSPRAAAEFPSTPPLPRRKEARPPPPYRRNNQRPATEGDVREGGEEAKVSAQGV